MRKSKKVVIQTSVFLKTGFKVTLSKNLLMLLKTYCSPKEKMYCFLSPIVSFYGEGMVIKLASYIAHRIKKFWNEYMMTDF